MGRKCLNSPDNICYICGKFTPICWRYPTTNKIKDAYKIISIFQSLSKRNHGLHIFHVRFVLTIYIKKILFYHSNKKTYFLVFK